MTFQHYANRKLTKCQCVGYFSVKILYRFESFYQIFLNVLFSAVAVKTNKISFVYGCLQITTRCQQSVSLVLMRQIPRSTLCREHVTVLDG